MADFEADKTSGKGPTLVMVHPLKLNDTESDKRASLIIDVNGVTKTVNLIQKKGSLNYEYELLLNLVSIHIPGSGGSKDLGIISRRREMINGTPQGDWENVEVTAEFLEEPPFTAGLRFKDSNEKTLEVSITSKNHTEQQISSTLTLKQVGGLTKTIVVTQLEGTVSYSYWVEPPSVSMGIPKDQVLNAYETSTGFSITGYRGKNIEGERVSQEVMPFKIPTIAQTKEVIRDNTKLYYWITDYGNIANTAQATLSATARGRKDAGAMFGSTSGGWECVFTDGGTYQFNIILIPQLM